MEALTMNRCVFCGHEGLSLFLKRKGTGDLFRCSQCHMIQNTSVSESIENIYKEKYFESLSNTKKMGYASYHKTPASYFQWQIALIDLLVPHGRLLDIGCATGKFLELLPSSIEAMGIDLSGYAVEVARGKGLRVERKQIEELVLDKKFDVITAWELVEHVKEPGKTLKTILSLLKKNGMFFLSTPDASKRDGGWQGFSDSIEHITYWNDDLVEYLKQKMSLEYFYLQANRGETMVLVIKKGRFTSAELKFLECIRTGKVFGDKSADELISLICSSTLIPERLADYREDLLGIYPNRNEIPYSKYVLAITLEDRYEDVCLLEDSVREFCYLKPIIWNYIYDYQAGFFLLEKKNQEESVEKLKKQLTDLYESNTLKLGRIASAPAKFLKLLFTQGIGPTTRKTLSVLRLLVPKGLIAWLKTVRDRMPFLFYPIAWIRVAIIAQKRSRFKGIVIYPPTVDWSWMKQRPHQIMEGLAKEGYLCFYVNINHKDDRGTHYFKKVATNLFVVGSIYPLFQIKKPILLISWTEHVGLIKRFEKPLVVYDYLDDLSVSAEEVDGGKLSRHELLLKSSRLVLATADRLLADASRFSDKVFQLPNASNYTDFHLEEKPTSPTDMTPILAKKQPIIGYYGAMAKWFNYELVKNIAKKWPEYQIVLIGPDYDNSIHSHRLDEIPNIHWLGIKPYSDLPKYLYYFDVAMIPFKVNQITRATSPVKIFEYMAGGKLTVSTPLDECKKYQSVLIAENVDGFGGKIEEAIKIKDRSETKSLIDKEAKENTWAERVELLDKELQRALREIN